MHHQNLESTYFNLSLVYNEFQLTCFWVTYECIRNQLIFISPTNFIFPVKLKDGQTDIVKWRNARIPNNFEGLRVLERCLFLRSLSKSEILMTIEVYRKKLSGLFWYFLSFIQNKAQSIAKDFLIPADFVFLKMYIDSFYLRDS